MTLEEAIEELKHKVIPMTSKEILALQLGVEALELVYELHQATAIDVEDIPSRLPSETE